MSIYANASGVATSFYLARILPGAPGRRISITLFDLGDAASSGSVKVVPPPEATVPNGSGTTALTQFPGCQYTAPPGLTSVPWGTLSSTNTDCSVSVSNSTWNGQVVQLSVPIPSGYSCSFTVQTGCWVKLSISFPSGTDVEDSTTWAAGLDGNPVRLVG